MRPQATIMAADLRPCACGNDDPAFGWFAAQRPEGESTFHYVTCCTCAAFESGPTADAATLRWNRRPAREGVAA